MTRAKCARAAVALLCIALLGGCGSLRKKPAVETSPAATASPPSASAGPASTGAGPTAKRPGAFYQDDGPGDKPPANLDAIADAVPKMEPLRAAANRPYTVLGRDYVPRTALAPFRQRGVASWYGKKFHGSKTSSGELYDMYAMTAAHPTLPIPSYARVTNVANQRTVIVRINDRGPFLSDRIMDLSYTAAYRLGFVQQGSATVELESIDPMTYAAPAVTANAGNRAPAASPVTEIALPDAVPARIAAQSAGAQAPVTAEGGGIYLQLGAFAQRDNAESFRTRIAQQLAWLNDTIQIHAADGLYRLRLGPYRDRAEAEGVAGKIRETLALKPTLILK